MTHRSSATSERAHVPAPFSSREIAIGLWELNLASAHHVAPKWGRTAGWWIHKRDNAPGEKKEECRLLRVVPETSIPESIFSRQKLDGINRECT